MYQPWIAIFLALLIIYNYIIAMADREPYSPNTLPNDLSASGKNKLRRSRRLSSSGDNISSSMVVNSKREAGNSMISKSKSTKSLQ